MTKYMIITSRWCFLPAVNDPIKSKRNRKGDMDPIKPPFKNQSGNIEIAPIVINAI